MEMGCGWLLQLHLRRHPCAHTIVTYPPSPARAAAHSRPHPTAPTRALAFSADCRGFKHLWSSLRCCERRGLHRLLVAMAGLAPTMMSCTAVRGNASSFMGSALSSSVAAPCAKPARMGTRISAVKTPEECNEEECAPTKEVGKLSMDWKTEDNTKVSGTYPPLARTDRKWTGYVEKDTAGQTNIYAVEPTIYVAESAISTGAAGGDASGSESSLAVVGGLAFVAVASAAFILSTVGKNAQVPATAYVGPPLSYYVSKFSQETSSPPAFSAQIPPIPESPPLSEDMSLAKPEVAVTEPVAAVSEAVSDATQ